MFKNIIAILSVSFILVSCGSGAYVAPFEFLEDQGDFRSISLKTSNNLSEIQDAAASVDGLVVAPEYSVTSYKLEYLTRNSYGDLVVVSGLLAVPDKSTPSPILSFQHGTTFKNSDAPSSNLEVNKRHPELAFASLGYIVFSPDYIGYGSSFGESHPYLQKEPSADIVIDMLRAGKTWLEDENIAMNGQLFLTGYSQGGYVSMAALGAMQTRELSDLEATGAVLGAGPYDLYEALSVLLHRLNNLPDFLNNAAIEILEHYIIPDDSEIDIERKFLDRYFDKNRQDDVHAWKPNIPLKLFHGADDDVVPIESAISTRNTMNVLGGDVELVECEASPADHGRCAIPYLNYTINYFEGIRTDR